MCRVLGPSRVRLWCRVAAVEKAEARKIQVVTAASAEAEAKFLQGQGIARQRQAIVNGLRESVINFSSDVSGAHCRPAMRHRHSVCGGHSSPECGVLIRPQFGAPPCAFAAYSDVQRGCAPLGCIRNPVQRARILSEPSL